MKDSQGHALSGANSASLTAYQTALDQFRCFIGDPVASVDAALQACPDMTMAYLLKAWLNLLGTEPAGPAVARQCCDAAARLPASDREQRHMYAARLLADGRWHEAGRALEDLSLHYPRDLLALQAGHQIDFFTGDSRMLRDRMLRAAPAWDRGVPGYHSLLSMQAFGFEETGNYPQAEALGRQSVELEPRDGWGWHAVAHVYEMTTQPRKGIAWLAPNAAIWAEGSFFAGHNWWHLALFHLGLDQTDEVLRLYDNAINGTGSSVILDLIDQSALLWRLQLQEVDVGERWTALADRWTAVAEPGTYAFNDMHAMMALAADGRTQAQQSLLMAMQEAMDSGADNARFTADVGYAATRAMQAFIDGDHALCASLLRSVRSRAHRFGGSHAQRDLIDLTLMEAARRAGEPLLADALAHERACLRPQATTLRAAA